MAESANRSHFKIGSRIQDVVVVVVVAVAVDVVLVLVLVLVFVLLVPNRL